jgi:hypothetical protein
MKKIILTIVIMTIAGVSFAQTKKDTTKAAYQPDPKRVYSFQLTADRLSSLIETSRTGVIPYLKSVKLTMDKLDEAQAYFINIHQQLADQFRKQYLTDSLNTVKPKLK